MDDREMEEIEKITSIEELYSSLSEDGKDRLIGRILESEEFMARILNTLLSRDTDDDAGEAGTGGYVDFLRKVRE